MVQINAALLAVLAGSAAAGSAHRAAHQALHLAERGYSTSAAPTYAASTPAAASTYVASSPAAVSTYPVDTTCTEEEASTSYVASSPAASSYVASSYVASSPAASSYVASSPAASSYVASTPVAASSYVASSPAAESSYVASSPVAESSAGSTYTSWVAYTSTAIYTVTGGAPASYSAASPSSYPAAGSGSPAECGTVTVTVTAGHAKHHKTHPAPVASTYVASSAPAASTYVASSPAPAPASSYVASSPAASYAKAAPTEASSNTAKRGVAMANLQTLNLGGAAGVGWLHNWQASASGIPSSLEFVPMLKSPADTSGWSEAASSAKYLLAFNEVDMTVGGGGSALTPAQAAAGYKQYLMPYAGSAKLGSPSVTSDSSENSNLNGVSAASGLDYLAQFAQACDGCQIDFAQWHYYGDASQSGAEQAEGFKQMVTQAIDTVQQLWGADTKLWITEFSALPTIDQDHSGVNQEFMENTLSWLDAQAGVERYSYYAAMPGLLCNADGSLTSIGQTYAS